MTSENLEPRTLRLSERWERTWRWMEAEAIDALIINGAGVVGEYGTVQFLTNEFPSHKGVYAVVRRGEPPVVVAASSAEARALRLSLPACIPVQAPESGDHLARVRLVAALAASAGRRIGLVSGRIGGLPTADFQVLQRAFGGRVIVDATASMADVKRVLGRRDADALSSSALIAEAGLRAFVARVDAGMSEHEGAAVIDSAMRSLGAVSTIVHVAAQRFHGQRPTARRIGAGEAVTVFAECANEEGYWAELGIVVMVGAVSRSVLTLARHCAKTLHMASALLRGEPIASEVANNILASLCRQGGYPTIGLGHGVGVDEDPPNLSVDCAATIRRDTGFAVHPSIATADGGISLGLANTYLISDKGALELSKFAGRIHRVPGTFKSTPRHAVPDLDRSAATTSRTSLEAVNL